MMGSEKKARSELGLRLRAAAEAASPARPDFAAVYAAAAARSRRQRLAWAAGGAAALAAAAAIAFASPLWRAEGPAVVAEADYYEEIGELSRSTTRPDSAVAADFGEELGLEETTALFVGDLWESGI